MTDETKTAFPSHLQFTYSKEAYQINNYKARVEHLHSLFKLKTRSPFHVYRYVSYVNFKCDEEETMLKFAAVANCILISVAPTLCYGWI
jgi:hypothetical protein